MANTTVSIRIDEDVKREADKLFNEFGINMSSAVNIFLRQAIRDRSIPFKITLDNLESVSNNIMDKYDEAFKELAK